MNNENNLYKKHKNNIEFDKTANNGIENIKKII